MEYTTFSRSLWNLTLFDTIGYDKRQKILHVHYFDRRVFQYVGVEEELIFEFIIALHKEQFYQEHIQKKHDYTIHHIQISS